MRSDSSLRKRNRGSLWTTFINAPYVIWAALFVVIPLIIIVVYAFNDKQGNIAISNLSVLVEYAPIIWKSIWYSLLATAISLVVAYPFVYIICHYKPTSQKMLNMFITLPMWINLLIKTYCLSALMDNNGMINQFLVFLGFGRLNLMNNTAAVIFGMVYNYLPYMILPIYNTMSKIDPRILEASEDLGCSPIKKLARVVFPLTVPGIVSGIVMVFVPSVSTFYISAKMGGPNDFMIGDLIEGQIHNQNNNLPVAAMLSLFLMIIILVSMLILNRFTDDEFSGGALI